jgi:hypothetical protein
MQHEFPGRSEGHTLRSRSRWNRLLHGEIGEKISIDFPCEKCESARCRRGPPWTHSSIACLTGAPLPVFTLNRTLPYQPSHALALMHPSSDHVPSGPSAQQSCGPQSSWTTPTTSAQPDSPSVEPSSEVHLAILWNLFRDLGHQVSLSKPRHVLSGLGGFRSPRRVRMEQLPFSAAGPGIGGWTRE